MKFTDEELAFNTKSLSIGDNNFMCLPTREQESLNTIPQLPKRLEKKVQLSSFVYKQDKPFDAKRLINFLSCYFIVIESSMNNRSTDLTEWNQIYNYEMTRIVESNCDGPHPTFNGCFRGLDASKGYFWIAGRDNIMGEWSQLGSILTLCNGGAWPGQGLSSGTPVLKDNRQELWFVGSFTLEDKTEIEKQLNYCLSSEGEANICFSHDIFEDWS